MIIQPCNTKIAFCNKYFIYIYDFWERTYIKTGNSLETIWKYELSGILLTSPINSALKVVVLERSFHIPCRVASYHETWLFCFVASTIHYGVNYVPSIVAICLRSNVTKLIDNDHCVRLTSDFSFVWYSFIYNCLAQAVGTLSILILFSWRVCLFAWTC
jgi:hypothetical protein